MTNRVSSVSIVDLSEISVLQLVVDGKVVDTYSGDRRYVTVAPTDEGLRFKVLDSPSGVAEAVE